MWACERSCRRYVAIRETVANTYDTVGNLLNYNSWRPAPPGRSIRRSRFRKLHFFAKKDSASTPACLRMARSVPSGMSPGWFGMVV